MTKDSTPPPQRRSLLSRKPAISPGEGTKRGLGGVTATPNTGMIPRITVPLGEDPAGVANKPAHQNIHTGESTLPLAGTLHTRASTDPARIAPRLGALSGQTPQSLPQTNDEALPAPKRPSNPTTTHTVNAAVKSTNTPAGPKTKKATTAADRTRVVTDTALAAGPGVTPNPGKNHTLTSALPDEPRMQTPSAINDQITLTPARSLQSSRFRRQDSDPTTAGYPQEFDPRKAAKITPPPQAMPRTRSAKDLSAALLSHSGLGPGLGRKAAAHSPLGANLGAGSGSAHIPEKVRLRALKKRRLRGWIPDQHGAWAMILVPILTGMFLSGPSWLQVLLLATWVIGYFAFFAGGLWLRSGRKERYWPPLRTYGLITIIFGVALMIMAPHVLEWAPLFAVLILVSIWQSVVHQERSLLSRTSTIIAAGLMAPVAYDVGTGFLRTGNFFDWLHFPSGQAAMPGISPTGMATGWTWVWVVTFCLTAYYWNTVPYVKTLIRNRDSLTYLIVSVATHLLTAAVVGVLAGIGYVTWTHFALWIVLSLRAGILPILAKKRHITWRPRVIGWSEVVATVFVIVTLLFI